MRNLYIKKKSLFEFKTVYCCVMYIMGAVLHGLATVWVSERDNTEKVLKVLFSHLLHSVRLRPRFRCITRGLNSGKTHIQIRLIILCAPSHSMLGGAFRMTGSPRVWSGRKTLDGSYDPHGSDTHPHSHYMTHQLLIWQTKAHIIGLRSARCIFCLLQYCLSSMLGKKWFW